MYPKARKLTICTLTSICLILTAAFAGQAYARTIKSKQATFKIETLADGLDHPWSLAILPDGQMLITERSGTLRLFKNGKLDPKPVSGLPDISSGGQGGLLDIIAHPKFSENRLVYFSYSAQDRSGVGTQVARAKLTGNKLTEVQVLFKALPKTRNRLHFGSRLLFDSKGFLFITLGEKFQMKQSQNIKSHLGSIIRLNEDGTIPADNPFVKNRKGLPEIFSYGHRNVQGIAMHPDTKKIWEHEHGPRGGDEVNILQPGRNYGWPLITYGIDYSGEIISDKTHLPGMEQPVIHWTPSIAPSGMTFYSGDKFPEWKGDLFVGALAHQHLRRLELKGDKVISQEILLGDLQERVRDVRNGPDGFLYILTDSSSGQLLRLVPAE
ncbi:MAG: PQQ-dependent sugar dehydrogenase [Methyloligellaceae bacterium]